MCTLVILRRPGHPWPLILAANRDEMSDRSWLPPDQHWPDRRGVTAGQDLLAGGTWLGVNEQGVVAGVLNRRGSLGTVAETRSRGELPLEALDHGDAGSAARALAYIDPASYRTFNLVVADADEAFWLRSRAGEKGAPSKASVEVSPISPGLSMLTAHDLNDITSPRIAMYLPRFRVSSPPDPARSDWLAWQALLASSDHEDGSDPDGAMRVVTEMGFGTLSSSLIALPLEGIPDRRPVWLFAAGPPGEAPYRPVVL